ncbi:hypothetical protein GIW81_03170 [Hyphomicrobium sp. xq]|uniref:Uncharacterized protein n=1 Tax=Hyphomicrobium album TaxID=2665159 RepID=A0A6I3KEQ2_9HYPH|nr:hypothetical protein [Hyphomicrobium album]MTD93334.1 hypothetical protein [Hyphomicrobium album]
MPSINPPPPGMPGVRDPALSSVIVNSGYGGLHATILSAVALVLSAFSLYEASFKTADIEIYVPPVIQYARDGGGDTEVFVVPITVTNSGARTGTVLSMELEVQDLKSKRTKRYYSAFLGEHQVDPDAPNRSFAPLSIPGKGTFSDTVRFYPVGNPLPKLAEEAGDYRFTLSLVTAAPARPDVIDSLLGTKPAPVVFERTLPWVSDQQLGSRRITISMPEKGWTAVPAAEVGAPAAPN